MGSVIMDSEYYIAHGNKLYSHSDLDKNRDNEQGYSQAEVTGRPRYRHNSVMFCMVVRDCPTVADARKKKILFARPAFDKWGEELKDEGINIDNLEELLIKAQLDTDKIEFIKKYDMASFREIEPFLNKWCRFHSIMQSNNRPNGFVALERAPGKFVTFPLTQGDYVSPELVKSLLLDMKAGNTEAKGNVLEGVEEDAKARAWETNKGKAEDTREALVAEASGSYTTESNKTNK